jgi:hypothetical protein
MTAKSQTPAPQSSGSGGGFFGLGLVLMVVVVAGAFYYVRRAPAHVATPPAASSTASAQSGATATPSDEAQAADPMTQSDVPPDVAAGTSVDADKWPADLPPLPLGSYQVTQPVGQVRAAYLFAARHPEVEKYVPCFCGCEMGGHTSNEDCFVGSRDANGRVTGWDPHGMT